MARLTMTNLDTGEPVDFEVSEVVTLKPQQLQGKLMDFPFEFAGVKGKPGDWLIMDGEVVHDVVSTPEFIESYDMQEYMHPTIRRVSVGMLSDIMLKRGATTAQVSDFASVVRDLIQLTDGKKPVYLASISPDTTAERAEMVQDIFHAVDLAGIIIPEGLFEIVGIIEGTG